MLVMRRLRKFGCHVPVRTPAVPRALLCYRRKTTDGKYQPKTTDRRPGATIEGSLSGSFVSRGVYRLFDSMVEVHGVG